MARLLVLALVTLILPGCAGLQSLDPPDVYLTSLEPLQSEGLEPRFRVGLRFQNPNNRDIEVEGINFDLDVNGRRLATGVSDEEFLLPKLGEARTTVTVTTSLVDIARQMFALSSAQGVDYRLKGKVHLGGLLTSIPFERSGSLNPDQTL
jgi:LEA14-like dessication related protein